MGHYFTNENLVSNIQKFHTTILGESFNFYTDNGVFSKAKLDYGTRMFLENLPLNEISGKVLDVGCGYGAIGITISKLCNVDSVTMCDVNRRALHLAERNAKENKVSSLNILESDCYQNLGDEKFDFILTNPPIRAGKVKVYEILMGAKDHLVEGGKIFLVVRKDQGAKSIYSDLEKHYNKVSVIERDKGFFVICCENS